MRDVYVLGIGQLPVSRYPDCLEYEMASAAIAKAERDARLEPGRVSMLAVGTMLSGILGHQQQLATHVADNLGWRGIETATVDAACSSGGAAARLGFMAVAGGFHECVAVAGVERMSHRPLDEVTAGLATASDWRQEGSLGETFISLNARLMATYMDEYGLAGDEFAPFSIQAHQNALSNPNAYLKKPIDQEKYANSRTLVAPIKLMDAPPVCDGAAALILGSHEMALAAGGPLVRVVASAVGTDSLALSRRRTLLELEGAHLSAQRAYAQAGLKPADIDLFELHDAYTIITALSLEAAGFALPGEGVSLGQSGATALDGDLPIATMGGLKARGHPVGATGVYQLVEATLQLREEAGANQVQNAHTAMTQS
ncbi:MAG: thiolase domain-containing protein, partial [Anaerolineales bacterium]|nr:thiolase domain-containing protein [Anaerolineales bacterium]